MLSNLLIRQQQRISAVGVFNHAVTGRVPRLAAASLVVTEQVHSYHQPSPSVDRCEGTATSGSHGTESMMPVGLFHATPCCLARTAHHRHSTTIFDTLHPTIRKTIEEIEADLPKRRRKRTLCFVRRLSGYHRRQLLNAVGAACLAQLESLRQSPQQEDLQRYTRAVGPIAALEAHQNGMDNKYWRNNLFTDLHLWSTASMVKILRLVPSGEKKRNYNPKGSSPSKKSVTLLPFNRRGFFMVHHRHHPDLPPTGQRQFLLNLYSKTSRAEKRRIVRLYHSQTQQRLLLDDLQAEAVTRLHLRCFVFASRESKIIKGGFHALVGFGGSHEALKRCGREIAQLTEQRKAVLLRGEGGADPAIRAAAVSTTDPSTDARTVKESIRLSKDALKRGAGSSSATLLGGIDESAGGKKVGRRSRGEGGEGTRRGSSLVQRVSAVWQQLSEDEKQQHNVLRSTTTNRVGRIRLAQDPEILLDYRNVGSAFDLYARYVRHEMITSGELEALVKENGGGPRVRQELHRRAAQQWKALTEDQRLAFQVLYPYGRGKVKPKRTLEPSASPFYQFVRSEADRLKIGGEKLTLKELIKHCCTAWRTMTQEEKNKYASTAHFDFMFPLVAPASPSPPPVVDGKEEGTDTGATAAEGEGAEHDEMEALAIKGSVASVAEVFGREMPPNIIVPSVRHRR